MTATMTSSHPTHLEAYGTHCSFGPCGLADFLPFTCPHCQRPYCSSHRTPDSHQCEVGVQAIVDRDRRAVSCPICNQVLKIEKYISKTSSTTRPGEVDVNLVMEDHLTSGECERFNLSNGLVAEQDREPSRPKKSANACKYGRCTNQMWIDLKCLKCGKGFCPTHREPKHHRCAVAGFSGSGSDDGSSRSQTPVPSTSKQAGSSATDETNKTSKLFNKLSIKPNTPSNVSSSLSAVKSTPKPVQSPPIAGRINSLSSKLTPASKDDRMANKRAARERESAALALKKRAEKGLLSEDEKVRYATLQALEAKSGKHGGNGKDCCIS